ncbi:UNVERIFIED_CONTAM: hypothetical protein FKN15_050683 [Acipenser sinensis]
MKCFNCGAQGHLKHTCPKLQPNPPASAATGDGEAAGEARGAQEQEPVRQRPVPPPRRSRPAEVQEPAVQTAAPETSAVSATVTERDGMFTGIIKKIKIKKRILRRLRGAGRSRSGAPFRFPKPAAEGLSPCVRRGRAPSPSTVAVRVRHTHPILPLRVDLELGGSAKAESNLGRGEPSCSGKAEDVSTGSHVGAVAVLTLDAPSEPTGAAETALVADQEIEEATLESEVTEEAKTTNESLATSIKMVHYCRLLSPLNDRR